MSARDLPLAGLLVADFSRILAGPLCTQLLADAGARVIKVEEPGRGDETRRWGPPFVDGVSAYFLSINRNKESLTLGLKSDEGRALAARLMTRADVVVDNFLPAQKRALRFPDPRAINERVVHCSIRGYDADSDDADLPGYDLLAQAGSGLMAITGEPDGEPMKVGVALADVLTAHHAFGGIMTALFARERNGRGARVDISLFSAAIASLVNVAQSALLTGRDAARHGNQHPSIVPYQLFHGADRPFAVGVGTDRHFQQLCERVLERPELASDPRFATNAARVAQRDVVHRQLEALFAARSASEWVARCRAAGIPASVVQGVGEALRSSAGSVLLATIDHPVIGAYELVRNPLQFDGERLPVRSAPPELGANSDAILRELGCDDAAIESLRRRGVV